MGLGLKRTYYRNQVSAPSRDVDLVEGSGRTEPIAKSALDMVEKVGMEEVPSTQQEIHLGIEVGNRYPFVLLWILQHLLS